MTNFTLYAEDEDKLFGASGKDKRGRDVTVDIYASSPEGAAKALDEAAKNYDVKTHTLPEEIVIEDYEQ